MTGRATLAQNSDGRPRGELPPPYYLRYRYRYTVPSIESSRDDACATARHARAVALLRRPMTRIEVSVSLCDLARGSCCSLSISRDHVQLCCLPLAVLSALVRLGNAPLDAL